MKGKIENEEDFILNGGLDASSFVSDVSVGPAAPRPTADPRVDQLQKELGALQKCLKNPLQNAIAQVQEESALVKEAVRCAREVVLGVRPEDVYFKLKDSPENSLSLPEWVLVKVYELVKPIERDMRSARLEISALREELRFKNEKLRLAGEDRGNLERLLEEKDRRYKQFENCLELSKKDLETHIKTYQEEVQTLQGRLLKEEEVKRENRLMKEDIKLLEYRVKLLDPTGVLEKTQAKKQFPAETKPGGATDAEHLLRENLRLNEELKSARREVELLTSENRSLSAKHERFMEKLLANELGTAAAYEKRISEELNALRERHAQELEGTRRSAASLADAELKLGRRQLEMQEARVSQLEAALADKDKTVTSLAAGQKELTARIESELVELRVTAKTKTEACDNLSAENAVLRARAEASAREAMLFGDKLRQIKDDMMAQTAKNAEDSATLRAEVTSLKRLLEKYEEIEKEVDRNLLAAADAPLGGIAFLGGVPTANGRRIQQVLELGRRLTESEKALADVQKELALERLNADRAKTELASVKSLYDKLKLPGSYLVTALEQKEAEIVGLKRDLSLAQSQVAFLTDAAEKQRRHQLKVFGQMEELERSRKELEQTRLVLAGSAQPSDLEKTRDFGKPKWAEILKNKRKAI